jgi:hypothetical protein
MRWKPLNHPEKIFELWQDQFLYCHQLQKRPHLKTYLVTYLVDGQELISSPLDSLFESRKTWIYRSVVINRKAGSVDEQSRTTTCLCNYLCLYGFEFRSSWPKTSIFDFNEFENYLFCWSYIRQRKSALGINFWSYFSSLYRSCDRQRRKRKFLLQRQTSRITNKKNRIRPNSITWVK